MDVSELCRPSSEALPLDSRISEHSQRLPSIRDPRTMTTTIALTARPTTGTQLLNKCQLHDTIIRRTAAIPKIPPIAQPLSISSPPSALSSTPSSSSPDLLPPLTATTTLANTVAASIADKHDPPLQHHLPEAIATCASLCQDIQQLRMDSPDSSPLDDIARKASELLVLLKQGKNIRKPEYAMIRRARNLQEGVRTSYRRRTKKTTLGQRCHSCHTTETPEWRRGPDGARTLCNACGLHYSKLMRRGSITVQQLAEAASLRMIPYAEQESSSPMIHDMDDQQESFVTYAAQPP